MKTQGRLKRHKRSRNRVVGFPEKPRVSVFRTKKHIYAQVINDQDSKTVASSSTQTKEFKSKNIKTTDKKAAETVGLMLADKVKTIGIKKVCFDKSGYKYHGRIKALTDGLRKGGLDF